jgi:hypothetical protein
MNKARLERLAQQFLPSTNNDGFAPLWWSKWCAGFCSAVDEDMGRSPRWCHYQSPHRHHRAELRVWLFCTFNDFEAARGRMPTVAELRHWVSAARIAAGPFAGLEAWTK